MRRDLTQSCWAILMGIVFFIFVVGPTPASAQWHPEDDDLPGLSTGEVILYGVLIAGAAIGVGLLIAKGKGDTEKGNTTDGLDAADSTGSSAATSDDQAAMILPKSLLLQSCRTFPEPCHPAALTIAGGGLSAGERRFLGLRLVLTL